MNTMISAEEKIYSPESKTPKKEKDNVPAKFEYVGPENLSSKKVIIGGAFVLSLIVAAAIVTAIKINDERPLWVRIHTNQF